jgi:acyl-coenzyme A thioesterase PaaI-like protein
MSRNTLTINPEYTRLLEKLVLDASYPRLIGMRLETIDIDRATILLDIDAQRHFQPFGIVLAGYWPR